MNHASWVKTESLFVRCVVEVRDDNPDAVTDSFLGPRKTPRRWQSQRRHVSPSQWTTLISFGEWLFIIFYDEKRGKFALIFFPFSRRLFCAAFSFSFLLLSCWPVGGRSAGESPETHRRVAGDLLKIAGDLPDNRWRSIKKSREFSGGKLGNDWFKIFSGCMLNSIQIFTI